MFEFGEDLFDWIEVRAVRRQEDEVRPLGSDRFAGCVTLVAAEVVEDDHVALRQGWSKHLLDIEREKLAIDGTIDDPGRTDPIMAQSCDEGHGLPVTMGCCCFETLSSWPPAAQGCHVGFDPGLIDEDQARRVNPALMGLPALAFAGDIWAILLRRPDRFF
jgi:hypothetical protein